MFGERGRRSLDISSRTRSRAEGERPKGYTESDWDYLQHYRHRYGEDPAPGWRG